MNHKLWFTTIKAAGNTITPILKGKSFQVDPGHVVTGLTESVVPATPFPRWLQHELLWRDFVNISIPVPQPSHLCCCCSWHSWTHKPHLRMVRLCFILKFSCTKTLFNQLHQELFTWPCTRWGHSIHMLAVKWFLPPRLTPTLMRLMGWAQWKYATSKAKAQ